MFSTYCDYFTTTVASNLDLAEDMASQTGAAAALTKGAAWVGRRKGGMTGIPSTTTTTSSSKRDTSSVASSSLVYHSDEIKEAGPDTIDDRAITPKPDMHIIHQPAIAAPTPTTVIGDSIMYDRRTDDDDTGGSTTATMSSKCGKHEYTSTLGTEFERDCDASSKRRVSSSMMRGAECDGYRMDPSMDDYEMTGKKEEGTVTADIVTHEVEEEEYMMGDDEDAVMQDRRRKTAVDTTTDGNGGDELTDKRTTGDGSSIGGAGRGSFLRRGADQQGAAEDEMGDATGDYEVAGAVTGPPTTPATPAHPSAHCLMSEVVIPPHELQHRIFVDERTGSMFETAFYKRYNPDTGYVELNQRYHFRRVLASTLQGYTCRAFDRRDGVDRCIKVSNLSLMASGTTLKGTLVPEDFSTEINMLRRLTALPDRDPGFAAYVDDWTTERQRYLAIEFCSGGDLFEFTKHYLHSVYPSPAQTKDEKRALLLRTFGRRPSDTMSIYSSTAAATTAGKGIKRESGEPGDGSSTSAAASTAISVHHVSTTATGVLISMSPAAQMVAGYTGSGVGGLSATTVAGAGGIGVIGLSTSPAVPGLAEATSGMVTSRSGSASSIISPQQSAAAVVEYKWPKFVNYKRYEIVRCIFAKLVRVVWWLKQNGVCHLDLSLENTLCILSPSCMAGLTKAASGIAASTSAEESTKTGGSLGLDCEDPEIKLIDFGVAQDYSSLRSKDDHYFRHDRCVGKTKYQAPEVYDCKYGALRHWYDASKADVWCLGVMLFMMVFLRHPYQKPSVRNDEDCKNLLRGKLKDWISRHHMERFMDPSGIDLLMRVFQPAARRISIDEMIVHPFISDLLHTGDHASTI